MNFYPVIFPSVNKVNVHVLKTMGIYQKFCTYIYESFEFDVEFL